MQGVGELAVNHVISRTVLDGFLIGDVDAGLLINFGAESVEISAD